jgi:hypothetical protein
MVSSKKNQWVDEHCKILLHKEEILKKRAHVPRLSFKHSSHVFGAAKKSIFTQV